MRDNWWGEGEATSSQRWLVQFSSPRHLEPTMTSHSIKATTVTTAAASQIQMPPKAKVPAPPADYDPTVTVKYGASQPRQGELASIAGAAKEVGAFPDWVAVFGKTAPPADHVVQAFDSVAQWSALFVATTAWFDYVRNGRAAAWEDARGLVEGLKAPFELASAADPTLTTTYPAVTRLLGVAKAIAKKGVATRKANAKAAAEGKPTTHGAVGKQRKKKAAAVALAATTTAAPAPEAAPVPEPTPAAPTSAAAPAVTNGAAHA